MSVRVSRGVRRLAWLVLSVVLVGCAPAAAPPPTAAPPKPQAAPTTVAVPTAPSKPPAAATAAPAAPTAGPVQAAAPAARTPELVVDIGADSLLSLDPIRWRLTVEKNAERLIYETLTVYDRNMQLQPLLATSWSLADDTVTWTFKLRQGVKFHDGTDFNAAAAKSNLDRMLDPGSTSLNAPTFASAIESVTAVDATTLAIKTKGPQSATLGMLAGWGGEMASPSALQAMGEEFNTRGGVGTGPYAVDTFTPRSQLVVKRFDGYWGQKGVADRITLRTIPEVAARVAALSSGQTQLAMNLPPNQLSAIKQNPNLAIQPSSTVYMEYIGLNTQRPPLDNPKVRQAIAHAIDMPGIVRDVYDGQLVVFAGPIPPPIFGHDQSITGYAHDPEKAKSLLKEAGLENPTLELWYYDRPDYVRFVQLLQNQLRAAGINTNIQKMEYATYYATLGNGEQQIFLQGWGNSTGDPQPTMNALFHSRAPETVNLTRYKNPEMDKLLDQIKVELDAEKRKGLLSQAVKLLADDAPMPYFFSPIRNDVFVTRLQGYTPTPVSDYHVLAAVSLAGN